MMPSGGVFAKTTSWSALISYRFCDRPSDNGSGSRVIRRLPRRPSTETSETRWSESGELSIPSVSGEIQKVKPPCPSATKSPNLPAIFIPSANSVYITILFPTLRGLIGTLLCVLRLAARISALINFNALRCDFSVSEWGVKHLPFRSRK